MDPAIYIQIFIGDYIRDTRELTPAERGIYAELLMYLQRSDTPGTREFALAKMHTLLGVCFDEMQTLLQGVLAKSPLTYKVISQDKIIICDEVMAKKFRISHARSQTGSKGGKKTQSNIKHPEIPFALAKIEANTQANSDNDNDNGNDTEGKGVQGENRSPPPPLPPNPNNITLPWPTHTFATAWHTWKEYQITQHHFRYSLQAEIHTLENLVILSANNEQKAIDLIKTAIKEIWKKIHIPDKNYFNANTRSNIANLADDRNRDLLQ